MIKHNHLKSIYSYYYSNMLIYLLHMKMGLKKILENIMKERKSGLIEKTLEDI